MEQFMSINDPSATVQAVTLVVNRQAKRVDPRNPFTEAEVQAVADQLETDDEVMVHKGVIYPVICPV